MEGGRGKQGRKDVVEEGGVRDRVEVEEEEDWAVRVKERRKRGSTRKGEEVG